MLQFCSIFICRLRNRLFHMSTESFTINDTLRNLVPKIDQKKKTRKNYQNK